MKPLGDWVAETPQSIAARLEGAKASQANIRLTIGTMAVVSVMMLIAAYNAYLAYDYDWILHGEHDHGDNKISEALTGQALRDWAASRTVMISLLGIRVSVDDAAVLGTSVLFVLSLWLLLLARREYYTIGSLLRYTDTQRRADNRDLAVTPPAESRPDMSSGGERWLIFHTIMSNSLFFTCDHSLSSVHSLGDQSASETGETGKTVTLKERLTNVALKFVRNFFFLFPAIAAFAVFCVDRVSYIVSDPFHPHFSKPGIPPFSVTTFFWRSLIVFFVCWIPLAICCWKSSHYSRTTEKVLRDYGDKLQADLRQQEHPASS
jgi:hypothetical protein